MKAETNTTKQAVKHCSNKIEKGKFKGEWYNALAALYRQTLKKQGRKMLSVLQPSAGYFLYSLYKYPLMPFPSKDPTTQLCSLTSLTHSLLTSDIHKPSETDPWCKLLSDLLIRRYLRPVYQQGRVVPPDRASPQLGRVLHQRPTRLHVRRLGVNLLYSSSTTLNYH